MRAHDPPSRPLNGVGALFKRARARLAFPTPHHPQSDPLRFRAATTTTPPPSFEGGNFCNCRNCSTLNWRRSEILCCGACFKVCALGGLRHPAPRCSWCALLVQVTRFMWWGGSTILPQDAPSELCWCAVQGWRAGLGPPSCTQSLQAECPGAWCKFQALGCVISKKAFWNPIECSGR